MLAEQGGWEFRGLLGLEAGEGHLPQRVGVSRPGGEADVGGPGTLDRPTHNFLWAHPIRG